MFCTQCAAETEQLVDGRCPPCNAWQGGGQDQEPAGFWVRFAAYFFDGIFQSIIVLFAVFFLALLMNLAGMAAHAGTAGQLLSILIGPLYCIVPTALYGQTLGKKICGLKVVMEDGSPATWGGSAIRFFCYIVSLVPLGLGFIWIGTSQEKRGFHDHIGGTRVVYCDPNNKTSTGVIVTIVLVVMFFMIAVMGILAAIAIPKFAELIRHANEGACTGNLGSLRSALILYYADKEGVYPRDLQELTSGGRYLSMIPPAKTPNYHADSAQVHYLQELNESAPADTGGWGYVGNPGSKDFGNIFVNCTHTDTKGKRWDSY